MYFKRRTYSRRPTYRRRYPTRRVTYKRPVVRRTYKKRNPAKRIVKRRFKGIQQFQFAKVLNTSQEVRTASASVEFYPLWTSQFFNSASDKFFNDNLTNYAQVMPLGFSVVFKDFSICGAGLTTPLTSIAGNVALYTFMDSCNIYPATSQMSYQNMRDLVGAKTIHLSSKKKSVKYAWYVPKSVRRYVPCATFKSTWNAATNQLKDALETVFGIDNLMVPKYIYVTQDDVSQIGAAKISYTIEWRFYFRFYGRIQDDDSSLTQVRYVETTGTETQIPKSRQPRSFVYPEESTSYSDAVTIERDQTLDSVIASLSSIEITPN
uniref:Capsid protein n=1 Tax=Cressdnaviricota sp. TaxID=2748378 RepID=A0A6M9Z8M1_9VIRU|nr:MAG: capsid protein [Cressdnaviricota sp.]